MGLTSEQQKFTKENFPEYTAEDLKELRSRYTPEQMTALESAEAAIEAKEFTRQGRLRVDPYKLNYVEDFKDIQPVIDRRPATKAPPNPNARFMNTEEFAEDYFKWMNKYLSPTFEKKSLKDFVSADLKDIPQEQWPGDVRAAAQKDLEQYQEEQSLELSQGSRGPTRLEGLEYFLERSVLKDTDGDFNSSMAPALPNKVPGVEGLYKRTIDPDDNGLDDTGLYQDLKKKTGLSVKTLRSFIVKTLLVRHVSNQTRMGKVRSYSVIAMAGNQNGWLGIGIVKTTEIETAQEGATLAAIRNMRPIRRYENRTIYGNVEAKFSGTVVRLSARPPGEISPFPSLEESVQG
jgi:small subunit ribosomal protein S5